MPASEDFDFQFTPVPSLARMFLATAAKRMVFVLGPIGSTKTTSCLAWLLMRAASQKPSPDGIRRTRFAVVRNTIVALKLTVLRDILNLFKGIVEWRSSENIIYIKVADLETEWILMGLDKPEDHRRLLSLQLSGVYMNEVREIPFDLIFAAFSRTGRFPNYKHGGVECSYRFLLADSNMGVEGSRLHDFLEVQKHPSVLYIHQPGALDPEADWLQYLPKGYYEDGMVGQSRAWIDTHIHAKWSADLSGEPIFAQVFNEYFHTADNLTIRGTQPMLGGVDPGLNPACVLGQYTPTGQLRIYRELFAENMLFGPFVDNIIIPATQMPGFIGRPHIFTMDPAGINRNAINGLSAKGVMEAKGFEVFLAGTNDIDPRLKAIEMLLTEVRPYEDADWTMTANDVKRQGPNPALLIDRRCPVLIEALQSKYRYKRKKLTQELEDKPEKKHPISDVVDGLGYLAMGVNTGQFKRRTTSLPYKSAGEVYVPNVRAWT